MFERDDRVTWEGRQVDCQFYGTIVSKRAPFIWNVRASGGALVELEESRLTKVFSNGE